MNQLMKIWAIFTIHWYLSQSLNVWTSKRTSKPDINRFCEAIDEVQSRSNKENVEEMINKFEVLSRSSATFQQKIMPGSVYRTVWSSVTASTFIGKILKQKPRSILGGDSWQTISKDGKRAENVVHWTLGKFSIRMAGMADLKPLAVGNGYELCIRGLEFRFGPRGYIPEVNEDALRDCLYEGSGQVKPFVLRLFYLDIEEQLKNGRGTLEVIYNDGKLRITRDSVQNNVYVHVLEPASAPFASLCER